MADLAHNRTDDILIDLEKRLDDLYKQAYKEVAAKAQAFFDRFKKKEAVMRQKVKDGQMTEKEFNEWRRRQMVTGKRWEDMRDTLAADLSNVNQIAAGMVNGDLHDVFALNANYTEYSIENGMRTNYGFTLYDRHTVENLVKNDPNLIPWEPKPNIAEDKRWNREMITRHITQGILQGESIPNLAKRMMNTVHNNEVAAVRTARTAVTAAENAGRQMVYEEAQDMGISIQKEWMATNDARTRPAHGAADGQRADVDQPFIVGGYRMMHPGDGSLGAPARLIYNCRCTTITVDPVDAELGEEPRMTYEEWQKSKQAEPTVKTEKMKVEKKKTEQPQKVIKTDYTMKQLNNMSRSQLETIAREVARKNAKRQGLTEAEALRRFGLLLDGNTTAQLRKYINKYGR